MALLSVRDLRTWFHTDAGVARAVDGVSFDVGRGEVVGVVGESGCGKSVTSLSIVRLVAEPPGEIQPGSRVEFDGRDLLSLSAEEMRAVRGNDIAMVFQEPMTSLNPVQRIGAQVAEPLRVHRGLDRPAARARALELLSMVGIPDPAERIDDYPHQLSGGMRQRVMIASALACEPALLIADEPTTALDVTIQAQILELLLDLRDRLGMAVILITHDLGVVAETCDRVVVMYAGRVVEQATAAELFRNPRHPYTEGLLKALPRLGRRQERLAVIPGAVPAPVAWPGGCRFHPRCPYAWDACAAEEPDLFPSSPEHESRCWLEPFPAHRTSGPAHPHHPDGESGPAHPPHPDGESGPAHPHHADGETGGWGDRENRAAPPHPDGETGGRGDGESGGGRVAGEEPA